MRTHSLSRVSVLAALSMSGNLACTPARRAGHEGTTAAPLQTVALAQAASYDTTVEKRGLRGDAANAELAKALALASKKAGIAADGRLAELSLGMLTASDHPERAPSFSTVTFHAHRAGIPEPAPEVWVATGSSVDALLPSVTRAIEDATRHRMRTHIGCAALYRDAEKPEAGVMIALALSTRALTLQTPVPRSVPVGASLHVAGELTRGFAKPVLAVTSANGTQRTPGVAGKRFRFDVPATHEGDLTLELLASGPEGLAVIALMPVVVGGELPEAPPKDEDDAAEASASEVAARLVTLIGEERARRKLPPLKTDPRLTKIALAHSEDMLDHDFVAHLSKRTGDATERVKRAGLDAVLVAENIGRGYSASELHQGLMASPGHRANILNADARELGIGVVAQREHDRDAFLVTELFTTLSR